MDLDQIPFERMDGLAETLAGYAGKVVLVVNVASQCGLTPQYAELEKLYQQYAVQGMSVLAFPANNFAAQEPGSNDEIAAFCQREYSVSFPVFKKISVAGDDQHSLYQALLAAAPERIENSPSALVEKLEQMALLPADQNAVLWNFEKFLISRSGQVMARFAPDITPLDPRVTHAVEQALAV